MTHTKAVILSAAITLAFMGTVIGGVLALALISPPPTPAELARDAENQKLSRCYDAATDAGYLRYVIERYGVDSCEIVLLDFEIIGLEV